MRCTLSQNGEIYDTLWKKFFNNLLEKIQTVLTELCAKGLHFVHVFPEFQPEIPAVVLHTGMDQFVEEDKVNEPVGKSRQFFVDTDIILRRAAPPAPLLISDGDGVTGKAVFPGQTVKAFPEDILRVFA